MTSAALRTAARTCSAGVAHAFRMQRQRLDQRTPEDLATLAGAVGYVPCPGGHTPYLSLWARSPRHERRPLERAVFEAGELVEAPFARRTTVLAPTAEAPFLRAAAAPSYRERAEPLVAAGLVDDRKRRRLAELVMESLSRAPLAADELRSRLPEPFCVSFGDAGRKAGMPSLFTLVLQDLWLDGRVQRRQRERRLDREAFAYAVTADAGPQPTRAEALAFLARRFFSAYAPSTASAFAFWADATLTEARAAVEALDVVELTVDDAREPALVPATLEADFAAFEEPVPGRLAFVPFRDPAVSWSRDLRPLLGAAHEGRRLADWRGRLVPAGGGSVVHQHFLLEGGRIAGVWDYDADAHRVRYATFVPLATRARRRADQAAEQLADQIRRDFGELRFYEDERGESFGRVPDTVAAW